MLLPSTFTEQVAKTFYDKPLSVLETIETTDEEGGVTKETTTTGQILANVRFTSLGVLQEELGLTEKIDISATCRPTEMVEVGQQLEYDGRRYLVTDVLPRDSHKLILGVKDNGSN